MKLNLAAVMGAVALFQTTSYAQVFVKPSGQKAIPVRVQSLRADVEIIGAFAITRWEMKIAMEHVGFGGYYSTGGICDFIVARPRDAKVTAFQVGQDGRTLAGRVVEKSLATPRLAFRAAPDDPLLKSGLNAGNSFRATIYPVNGWNQATVSGTWVQVLPAVRNRSVYRLPLLSLRGATTRLTALNAKISVREANGERLSNNFGLSGQSQGGSRIFALGQRNYRVTRDLVVNLARPSVPLQAAMLVTPDAAKNGGYFALAALADRAVKNPRVSGAGIEPSNVLAPQSARAGEVMLLSGRYRGDSKAFKARFTADGEGALDVTPVENGVAAALWATQKINALGTTPAHRAQVIALSKTHSVASRFTSWLAVSDQDLKIYARALVSSQLDPLVREYWVRIGDGQEKSARVVRLRSAIAQISRANGLNVEDEIHTRLGSAYGYVLSQKYGDYGSRTSKAKQAKVERRVARIGQKMLVYVSQLTNKKAQRSIDWASPIYGGELLELRTKIVGEYRKPHPDYNQLKGWELRFARLYGSTYIDPRLNFWRAQVRARELEAQTQNAEKAGDQTKLAQIQGERIQNSRQAYFVNNIGDPPIYVSAPADARQVVAVMPDGKIKVLDYNATQKRWEGNYDVPTTTQEGDYSIQIVIVGADKSRRSYAMKFRVDTTPPTGQGQVLLAPAPSQSEKQPRPLRLEIEHGGDVARVTALLPWGEKVALLPSTSQGNRFFLSVPVPQQWQGKTIHVSYILVDRAHNLTTIEAESVSQQSP